MRIESPTGRLSVPSRRITSSIKSTSRSMSMRCGGTVHTSASPCLVGAKPSAASDFIMSASLSSMPSSERQRAGRMCTVRGAGMGPLASITPLHSSPPAVCRISHASRSAAASIDAGCTPRSKRLLLSLAIWWRRLICRTSVGLKVAASSRMSVVVSSTDESAPPFTPASATGRSASAITRSAGESLIVCACSPSGRKGSPAVARRTRISAPRSFLRSNTCVGWPISSSTKLVQSTRLLRGS